MAIAQQFASHTIMSSKVPTAHVWDLVGHDGPVVNAKFNKDGRYCMTCGGKDRTLRLWNPSRLGPDGRGALLVKTYTGPHGYEIKDVVVYVSRMCGGCADPR